MAGTGELHRGTVLLPALTEAMEAAGLLPEAQVVGQKRCGEKSCRSPGLEDTQAGGQAASQGECYGLNSVPTKNSC